MTTYEPADVARAVTIEARGHRIDEAIITVALKKMGVLLVDPASVVVLDPEREADVDSVANAIRNHHKPGRLQADVDWLSVQAALRSLLPTPPLPEPNGLGAVVWCMFQEERCRGIYDGSGWTITRPGSTDYGVSGFDMDVVAVDQHGVGCTCGGTGCNGVRITREAPAPGWSSDRLTDLCPEHATAARDAVAAALTGEES